MLNILLADDIEGWLLFHKRNLEAFFMNREVNYYLFKSATEAYNFALGFSDKIDLVITDLEMEAMDMPAGEWLINNLKNIKSTKDSRYIIISASPSISFVAKRADADAFLRKASYHSNPLELKYQLEEMLGVL